LKSTPNLDAMSFLTKNGKSEVSIFGRRLGNVLEPVPCARSLLGFAYLEQSKLADAEHEFATDWIASSQKGCLLGKLGIAALDEKKGDTQAALREISEAAAIDPAFVVTSASTYLGALTAGGQKSKVGEILAAGNPAPALTARPEADASEGRYSACASSLAPIWEELGVRDLRLLCRCSCWTGQAALAMAARLKHARDAAAQFVKKRRNLSLPRVAAWRSLRGHRCAYDFNGLLNERENHVRSRRSSQHCRPVCSNAAGGLRNRIWADARRSCGHRSWRRSRSRAES
jgi:hypothetical protein